jgi:hypothetical protein
LVDTPTPEVKARQYLPDQRLNVAPSARLKKAAEVTGSGGGYNSTNG